jgi:transposase
MICAAYLSPEDRADLIALARDRSAAHRLATRSTRDVGAYISQAFGVVYESCARVIALLHRLGLEHRKPEVIGRKLGAKSSRRL